MTRLLGDGESNLPHQEQQMWRRFVGRWGDRLFVLAVALGFHSLFTGGFRVHLGNLRVSNRGTVDAFVQATVILVIRHVLVPSPSILLRARRAYGRVISRFTSGAEHWNFIERVINSTSTWRFVLAVVVVTRLAVLTTGFLAAKWAKPIGDPLIDPAIVVSNRSPLATLNGRWDAGWYAEIAVTGYRWDPNEKKAQQNVAFFPAFPLAVRSANFLISSASSVSGHPIRLGKDRIYHSINVGVCLSIIAFAVALVFLERLARIDLGPTSARWTVVLAASYPFAYFYSASYTEAMYLAVVCGAFLFQRLQKLGPMIVCGLLVGLTRQTGFLVAIPLSLVALVDSQRNCRSPRVANLIGAMSPAIGTGIYCSFLLWRFGDPIAWVKAQKAWAPAHRWKLMFSSPDIGSYIVNHRYEVINLVPIYLAAAAAIKDHRKLTLLAVASMLGQLVAAYQFYGWRPLY
jgi:hypothetical protein